VSLTRLARRRSFQCLHRYEVKDWSEQKNLTEFGACFTPHGHGHNYEIEAYFEGHVDKTTGMILNLADVDHLLEKVIAPIEGKHLNFEVPEFKNQVPTTEILAEYLSDKLFKAMKAAHKQLRLVKIRLFESEDLWVDVWP
jgi:6-pyruvoyltetrahydropterin/6-carboxytetrahydropterin synthase